jgi:hypothetical protein
MRDTAAFVETAWREGVGPDDRPAIAALTAGNATADAEVALFAAWLELLSERAVEVPAAAPTPAGAVLHAAATLAHARITRDSAAIKLAFDALAAALDALRDDAPHAVAARAWADLALGDLARTLDDAATMRRRFEAVATRGQPIALRIVAALRLVGVALARLDQAPARTWARRALTIAEAGHRPADAARARLLLGMLEHASGNVAAAQRLLTPVLDTPDAGVLARVLLASMEDGDAAMARFAEGLRRAVETGDLAAYLLCVLIGSRRYVALGRRADALVTISAGIVELRRIAPPLAAVLEEERVSWHTSWPPDVWAAAEAEALASL